MRNIGRWHRVRIIQMEDAHLFSPPPSTTISLGRKSVGADERSQSSTAPAAFFWSAAQRMGIGKAVPAGAILMWRAGDVEAVSSHALSRLALVARATPPSVCASPPCGIGCHNT